MSDRNHNRNRNRNRNSNGTTLNELHQQEQQPFDTPEPHQRIDFEQELCIELNKLLSQKPWKVHKFYGVNEHGQGQCEKVINGIKLPNTITTIPTNIRPHQVSFINKYGYLPRTFHLPKRQKKNNKNKDNKNVAVIHEIRNKNIERKNRLKRREKNKNKNINVWHKNKRKRWKERNKNKKRRRKYSDITKELSHICGEDKCITVEHLTIESHKKNTRRSTCHKAIDKKVRRLRAKRSKQKGRKGRNSNYKYESITFMTLDDTDSVICDHSPPCFRNYCPR